MKKMLLAILAGFVVMFLLAGLFHLLIMKDYFVEKLGGPTQINYAIISYLVLAVLMSYIYPHGFKGTSVVKEGLRFGILMGLICRVPWEILELSFGRGDWGFVITEGLWHAVEEGIGGIAIAMVYGKSS